MDRYTKPDRQTNTEVTDKIPARYSVDSNIATVIHIQDLKRQVGEKMQIENWERKSHSTLPQHSLCIQVQVGSR